ncbi:MAG: hypothetical protein KDD50_10050 [Bdellovibrionales bacterium]|nr:hypothetical protein [Bdellovibrionales bacterium]
MGIDNILTSTFKLSFLCFFLMGALTPPALADNLNNRTRVLSAENLVLTPIGKQLLEEHADGNKETLLENYVIIPEPEKTLFQTHSRSPQIEINSVILASGPTYYSFLLAGALADLSIKKIELKHGVNLGQFIERTQWSMFYSALHWLQLGSPKEYDPLYFDHNPNLVEKIMQFDSSSSKWSEILKQGYEGFISYCRRRHLEQGLKNKGLNDIISNGTSQEKLAAQEIKDLISAASIHYYPFQK